ncbi:hypothetical protein EDB83DRAFT_2574245 [Lactarius deliciosus]|nr:hypothetical protein EDB83DRAFT_2574245 [Lactarius deliciosus]
MTSAEDASELTSVFLCRHYSMHGDTFLSYDGPSTMDSHTLISLQRLYSTLNTSSAQPLSPPYRLFFPAVSTFMDHPGPVDENIPRRRSNISAAPETLKAAYPSLAGQGPSMQTTSMTLSALAHRSCSPHHRRPLCHASCRTPSRLLEAAEDWFDPVRHTLAWYFGAPEEDTAVMSPTFM